MRDDNIHVDGKVVMKVIENIVTISKHISWVPTKMPILDEWRSFLKGLADAEGLEIEFEPTNVQTDLQVEKSKSLSFSTTVFPTHPIKISVEAAKKRGSRKRIHAETMTEIDLRLLYDTLVDHFASSQTSVALNPMDEGDADIEDLYKIFDQTGTDMGVTKFRRLDDQELMDLLDFPEGRPVLFAKYRHNDTTQTPWESPDDRMWDVGGELLQPLRLLWHQLCGVASLVDGVFQKPGARVQNRLLADDVGIGKSAQVMGLIAFLILVWFAEKEGKTRPRIIADGNYSPLKKQQNSHVSSFCSQTGIHGPRTSSEPTPPSYRPQLSCPAMDPGTEDLLQSQANRDPSAPEIRGGSGGILPVRLMGQVGCSYDPADRNSLAYGVSHYSQCFFLRSSTLSQ